jgi:putative membrane protein
MIILAKWFLTALAFLIAASVVSGIYVAGTGTALILAIFWGVLNITIRPLLILLTLPITLITFGFFSLVINGFLLWLLGSIIKGFEVNGFFNAFFGALIISVVGWAGNKLFSRIHSTENTFTRHNIRINK